MDQRPSLLDLCTAKDVEGALELLKHPEECDMGASKPKEYKLNDDIRVSS